MNLDYEALRLLAWGLLVLALIAYSICEGINLGTLLLLPLIADSDKERQLILASISPTAQGQQAWLIAVMAILFAAWPMAFAISLACLIWPFSILMLAWLLRPIGLVFRDAANLTWRQHCDKGLAISGGLSIFVLGLIAGNLIKGIPFHLDNDMRIFFLGNVGELLNPFALLVAAVSMALILCHAALFLQLNPHTSFYANCKSITYKAGLSFIVLFILTGLWVSRLEGYHISSEILTNASSNPLAKFVKRGEGLWLDNYEHQFSLWIIPSLAVLASALSLWFCKLEKNYWAFLASSVAMTMSVFTTAFTLFPFIIPSNRSLNTSLTLWDASASQANLSLLVPILLIGLPIMALLSRGAFRLPNHLSLSPPKPPSTSCSSLKLD